MRTDLRVMTGMAGLLLAAAAFAAGAPAVYPAKGQSPDRQMRDEGECNAWAKKSTGVDPAAVAAAAQQPPAPGGERMRGAARGAVGGAAIGAIAGDAGKGAGIGAVVGTMHGGSQARKRQQSETQGSLDSYYRAYGACMSGRGYSVS